MGERLAGLSLDEVIDCLMGRRVEGGLIEHLNLLVFFLPRKLLLLVVSGLGPDALQPGLPTPSSIDPRPTVLYCSDLVEIELRVGGIVHLETSLHLVIKG